MQLKTSNIEKKVSNKSTVFLITILKLGKMYASFTLVPFLKAKTSRFLLSKINFVNIKAKFVSRIINKLKILLDGKFP